MSDAPLALLAIARDIDCAALRAAIDQTFNHRDTHPVPSSVPAPPPAWERLYAQIAAKDGLEWQTLEEVTRAVQRFLDPVLAGVAGKWDAETWSWSAAHESAP